MTQHRHFSSLFGKEFISSIKSNFLVTKPPGVYPTLEIKQRFHVIHVFCSILRIVNLAQYPKLATANHGLLPTLVIESRLNLRLTAIDRHQLLATLHSIFFFSPLLPITPTASLSLAVMPLFLLLLSLYLSPHFTEIASNSTKECCCRRPGRSRGGAGLRSFFTGLPNISPLHKTILASRNGDKEVSMGGAATQGSENSNTRSIMWQPSS